MRLKERLIRRAAMTLVVVSSLPPQMLLARPSMARAGGGGARPAMARPAGGGGGGGAARPSMARPAGGGGGGAARPSMPNVNRPSMSNVSRPAAPKLPSAGGATARPANVNRPSLSGMPSRPQAKPAPLPNVDRPGNNLNRPTSKLPPSVARPTTRPQPLPGGVGSGINRPEISTRPAQRPNINRPNQDLPSVARPTPLPGNRPGRPTTLPADRPSFGNINRPNVDRPNFERPNTDRPNLDRPNIDRPTTLPARPDRPIIGRPGDNNLIVNRPGDNINNITNINNSINWNQNNWNQNNWTRPWHQDHNWADHYYDHHINDHYHGWYHGCWAGHWDDSWYVPLAVGATAWGLNRVAYWNYASTYYNPYYVVPTTAAAVPVYNYSQPIVLNNYASAEPATGDASVASAQTPAPPQANPAANDATALVDQAREKFYGKQYATARELCDKALQKSPQDPVIHELRALCLFALGEYPEAAATLNALLATAPGMDWTTMSTLYKETSTYTLQLRKLEKHCEAKPDDAAAAFVLAYHYLVLGEQDAAVDELRRVVQNQPRDTTAKRMLDALAPEAPKEAPKPAAEVTATADKDSGATKPQTDLVGSWKAVAGDATIELSVDDSSQFRWTAKAKGQPDVTLTGQLATTSSTLVLDGGEQGVLVANVTPKSATEFDFAIQGAPNSDSKLVFQRVNSK